MIKQTLTGEVMNGLSKITDKILNQARAEAADTLSVAEERCTEISAEYASRAGEIRRKVALGAKAKAEEIINCARSSGNIMEKNMILSAKVELIDKAFAKAEREILDMPEEKYVDLLSSLLASTFVRQLEEEKKNRELYGKDSAEVTEKYEVLLCKTDKERIGDKLIPDVKRKLVGRDALDKFGMIVMARETVDIKGGFILRVGSMDINNSVEAILGELRPRLECEINKILFSDKKNAQKS
jgi:V/A-type H+-transporting ATPase subunit E